MKEVEDSLEFIENNLFGILGDPLVFKIFGLTAGETNLLRMVWIEKKTFSDLAPELKVTENSIRKLYRSAAEKLKRNISGLGLELAQILAAKAALQKENGELKRRLADLAPEKKDPLPQSSTVLDMRIEKLKLSIRAYNALKVLNVNTLGDAARCSKTDLMKMKNFGNQTLTLLEKKLKEYDIALKD
jgi:hypothetical protein